jgi:hypothetical protein
MATDVCKNLFKLLEMKCEVESKERTLAFKPSLQMASQSSLDCSEAQGLVSSIYSK